MWYWYLYRYGVLRSRVGVLHITEIGRNAFIEEDIPRMTHILPSRWPKLCEYIDSKYIVSHWAKAQGTIWSLPPCINVYLWLEFGPWKPNEYWELGQRLKDNSGYTWRYQTTTWDIDNKKLTLDIWQHSIERKLWWEYSIQGFLYDHKGTLLALAEKVYPYATAYQDLYPPWLRTWQLNLRPIAYPFVDMSIVVKPSSLANMWPEVPIRLADGTESRGAVPELPGNRS